MLWKIQFHFGNAKIFWTCFRKWNSVVKICFGSSPKNILAFPNGCYSHYVSRLPENNVKVFGKRHLGVQLAKMIPAPQVATIFFQSRWFIQIFHLRKFKYEIYRLFCPFYLTELYLYYFIIRCTYVGGWVFPFIWPYNLKNLTHRKKDALVKL